MYTLEANDQQAKTLVLLNRTNLSTLTTDRGRDARSPMDFEKFKRSVHESLEERQLILSELEDQLDELEETIREIKRKTEEIDQFLLSQAEWLSDIQAALSAKH